MRASGILLSFAVLACNVGESAVAPGSSLLAMDSDRLWVLLQAAKVLPRCRELYAGSTDPRVTGLATKCDAAERRIVAWLAANDVEEPQAEQLREPEFWQWYAKKLGTIQACQKSANPDSATFWSTFHACDPHDRITRVEKRSVTDAGYRQPKD